jgi:hypothetical protein
MIKTKVEIRKYERDRVTKTRYVFRKRKLVLKRKATAVIADATARMAVRKRVWAFSDNRCVDEDRLDLSIRSASLRNVPGGSGLRAPQRTGESRELRSKTAGRPHLDP